MPARCCRQRRTTGTLVQLLIFVFVLSCGGGGGSTDNSGAEAPPSNPLRQAIESAVTALDEEAAHGMAMEKLYVGNQLAGNLVPMARGEVAPGNPSCVAVDSEGETLILTFDGSDACKAVSGTLRITAVDSQLGDPTVLVTDIQFIDFDTGDGCPVNGIQRTTVTIAENRITAVCSYTDVDFCGQTHSGEVVLNGETPDAWQLELEAQTYHNETGVEVRVDMVWQPDTGAMTGEAVAWLDGAPYAMRAEGVVVDASCGLPTSGSLTITDPEGNTAVADFTDTTCDAPQFSVIQQGAAEVWTLFETP